MDVKCISYLWTVVKSRFDKGNCLTQIELSSLLNNLVNGRISYEFTEHQLFQSLNILSQIAFNLQFNATGDMIYTLPKKLMIDEDAYLYAIIDTLREELDH